MSVFSTITKPTLLLNEDIVRANIRRMAEKARQQSVRLRPHFKTHQSAEIGEWFRQEGVNSITVSSIDMARYFADAGWEDITIAFSVNLRQTEELYALARQVRLGLLVESRQAVDGLAARLPVPVDIWIKVDTGAGRTGIAWQSEAEISLLAKAIQAVSTLRFQGLLTHAGQTYRSNGPLAIQAGYAESVQRINFLRTRLLKEGFAKVEVSVGDTPGCTLVDSFGQADEIRPGNFVFFDASQVAFGVCQPDDVAVALACPIVAVHPDRSEVVIHGGAVHLSTDYVGPSNPRSYGLVCLPEGGGWSAPLEGAYVRGLSQEHGILHVRPEDIGRFEIGGLVCILPAHSCLTVACMRRYITLDGEMIEAMP